MSAGCAKARDDVTREFSTITTSGKKFSQEFGAITDQFGNSWGSASKSVQSSSQTIGKEFSTLSKSSNELANSWDITRIAVTGLVGAFGAMQVVHLVTESFKEGRKEYQEATLAHLKLTAALGHSAEGLREINEATAANLHIEEKDVEAVEAKIGAYVKNDAQIKQLLPAIMDLGAYMGDNTAAAALLGRSISSDTGELARLRIHVEGAADSQQRINSIIQGVTSHFGGQAKAVADAKDIWDLAALSWRKFNEDLYSRAFGKESPEQRMAMLRYEVESLKTALATPDNWKTQGFDLLGTRKGERADMQKRLQDAQRQISEYNEEQITKQEDLEKEHKANALKESNALTEKLTKELWEVEEGGRLNLLRKEMAAELNNTELTEQQKGIIRRTYELKIAKEIAEEKKALTSAEEKAGTDYANTQAEDAKVRYETIASLTKAYDDLKAESLGPMEKLEQERKDALAKSGGITSGGVNSTDIIDKTYALKKIELQKKLDTQSLELQKQYLTKYKKLSPYAALEAEYKEDLSKYKNVVGAKELIDKDYAAKKKLLDNMRKQSQLEMVNSDLASLSTIAKAFGASARVQKTIDEGQAIISGVKGELGVLANSDKYLSAFGPIGGPIAMGAEMALIAGMAAGQIAMIEKQSFSTGVNAGFVQGTSYGDRVNVLANAGEAVLTPAQQMQFIDLANGSGTSSTGGNLHIHAGDIIIQGNADNSTVRQINKSKSDQIRNIRQLLNEASRKRQTSGFIFT